jgi:hypothetical protein
VFESVSVDSTTTLSVLIGAPPAWKGTSVRADSDGHLRAWRWATALRDDHYSGVYSNVHRLGLDEITGLPGAYFAEIGRFVVTEGSGRCT